MTVYHHPLPGQKGGLLMDADFPSTCLSMDIVIMHQNILCQFLIAIHGKHPTFPVSIPYIS